LLGDSDAFVRDLVTVAQFYDQPGSIACPSAVSVELLHNALVKATEPQVSTSFEKVIQESYAQVMTELGAVSTPTLFGLVVYVSCPAPDQPPPARSRNLVLIPRIAMWEGACSPRSCSPPAKIPPPIKGDAGCRPSARPSSRSFVRPRSAAVARSQSSLRVQTRAPSPRRRPSTPRPRPRTACRSWECPPRSTTSTTPPTSLLAKPGCARGRTVLGHALTQNPCRRTARASASTLAAPSKCVRPPPRLTLTAARQTNDTSLFVCSKCTDLFKVSACYGSDAVRNVTVYPYFRSSTCGQDGARAACEALMGNRTQVLVVPCDYTPWFSAPGIFAATMLCLCFAINVGFAALVARHRNAKAIKYAQFPLLLAFIGGACLICAFGLVFVGPATAATCQMRTWLFNVSVTVCLTPLFLKAYRVWLIFENPKLKHMVVTNLMLFKLVCAVLLAELLWLAIWTGVCVGAAAAARRTDPAAPQLPHRADLRASPLPLAAHAHPFLHLRQHHQRLRHRRRRAPRTLRHILRCARSAHHQRVERVC
jgi:hypothetical protein